MSTLRERCEDWWGRISWQHKPNAVTALESFARDIRNEALEEAAEAAAFAYGDGSSCAAITKRIKALKQNNAEQEDRT